MKGTERAFELLAGLADGDRQWILERLSQASKRELLQGSGHAPSKPKPRNMNEEHHRQVDAAPPQIILERLKTEPVWLQHLILQLGSWTWREEFLRGLPPTVRVELTQPEAGKVKLGKSASEFLLKVLAESLGPSHMIPQRHLSFETLVTRFKRKARSA